MTRTSIPMKLVKESEHRIGVSRFLGNPDLPDSLLEEEELFSTTEIFLGQISLKDLPECDLKHKLPASGMLYFFLEIGEMPYEAHVIYYGGDEVLDEVLFNEDTEAELLSDIGTGYELQCSVTTEESDGHRDDGGAEGLKLFGFTNRLSWGYLDTGKELLLQVDLKELPDFLGKKGFLYFIIDKQKLEEGAFSEVLLQTEFGADILGKDME